jgi:hypothetical protein
MPPFLARAAVQVEISHTQVVNRKGGVNAKVQKCVSTLNVLNLKISN